MNTEEVNKNIAIAIGLLDGTRTDYYGNGRVTHSHRNFISQTVKELLEQMLLNTDQSVNSIIPKNTDLINPPDES
jgi:hypothetical protein